MNFTDLPAATTNQPASALGGSWDRLPTVAFLTPDLCNDMHDCPVATGDAWAKKTLGSYLDWARTHNSLLVLTFGESETSTPDNPIPTILAGPMVRPGLVTTRIDHYSMLRTIEDMYGLKALGHSSDAVPITDIWRTQAAAPQVPTTPRGPGDGRGPFDARDLFDARGSRHSRVVRGTGQPGRTGCARGSCRAAGTCRTPPHARCRPRPRHRPQPRSRR